jgi:hypothetical protein
MIFHNFVDVLRLIICLEMMCEEWFNANVVSSADSFSKLEDKLSVSIAYHRCWKFIDAEYSSLHDVHQLVDEQRHHEFV